MDLNGDGYQDILSGSYSRPGRDMAGLFQVLWGTPEGGFKAPVPLMGTDSRPLLINKAPGDTLTTVICTRPFAADWNGDGRLDLVAGNFEGGFHLFLGAGQAKFNPTSKPLMADGKPLRVHHHSDPFCIDWDGDGDLDILSGSASGEVSWAENRAGPAKEPDLSKFQTLIPPSAHPNNELLLSESDLKGPRKATRIWVADINKDGKLDILVGDNLTLISPAKGLSEAQYQERQKAWQQKLDELNAAFTRPPPNTKRSTLGKALRQHRQSRKAFIRQQRTGFVWLYTQK